MTYAALFDGTPALITDSGTMADFLDEDDEMDFVTVEVFPCAKARDRAAEALRKRTIRAGD